MKREALALLVLLDPLPDEGREPEELKGQVSWVRPEGNVDRLCSFFIGQNKMWLQGRPGNVVLLCAQEEKENVLVKN